jgi:hypothetical protein
MDDWEQTFLTYRRKSIIAVSEECFFFLNYL